MEQEQSKSQRPLMSAAMTPASHATELRLVGDVQSFRLLHRPVGLIAGSKSAGEHRASEQEGALTGSRAREDRCRKSPRAAEGRRRPSAEKRCMGARPGRRWRRIGRASGFTAQPRLISPVTYTVAQTNRNGRRACFSAPILWSAIDIGQDRLSPSTPLVTPSPGTGEVWPWAWPWGTRRGRASLTAMRDSGGA